MGIFSPHFIIYKYGSGWDWLVKWKVPSGVRKSNTTLKSLATGSFNCPFVDPLIKSGFNSIN